MCFAISRRIRAGIVTLSLIRRIRAKREREMFWTMGFAPYPIEMNINNSSTAAKTGKLGFGWFRRLGLSEVQPGLVLVGISRFGSRRLNSRASVGRNRRGFGR